MKLSVGMGLTVAASTGDVVFVHVSTWLALYPQVGVTFWAEMFAVVDAELISADSCHCQRWKNSPAISRRTRRRKNPSLSSFPGASESTPGP
jgi:hypothetical protein